VVAEVIEALDELPTRSWELFNVAPSNARAASRAVQLWVNDQIARTPWRVLSGVKGYWFSMSEDEIKQHLRRKGDEVHVRTLRHNETFGWAGGNIQVIPEFKELLVDAM